MAESILLSLASAAAGWRSAYAVDGEVKTAPIACFALFEGVDEMGHVFEGYRFIRAVTAADAVLDAELDANLLGFLGPGEDVHRWMHEQARERFAAEQAATLGGGR